MYDMSRVTSKGYFDAEDSPEARYNKRVALNNQRTIDYKSGTYKRDGGVIETVTEDTPFFVKRYHDYYKTSRGYHHRSPNSNVGKNETVALSFLNMPILSYIEEIRSAVLLVHGSEAHSRYFSEDAYKRLKGDNKELLIVKGADHTDLYDNLEVIPFDKIESFLRCHLFD